MKQRTMTVLELKERAPWIFNELALLTQEVNSIENLYELEKASLKVDTYLQKRTQQQFLTPKDDDFKGYSILSAEINDAKLLKKQLRSIFVEFNMGNRKEVFNRTTLREAITEAITLERLTKLRDSIITLVGHCNPDDKLVIIWEHRLKMLYYPDRPKLG